MTQEAGKSTAKQIFEKYFFNGEFCVKDILLAMEEYAQQREQPAQARDRGMRDFGSETIEQAMRVLIDHAKECETKYNISGDAVIEMAEIVLARHLSESEPLSESQWPTEDQIIESAKEEFPYEGRGSENYILLRNGYVTGYKAAIEWLQTSAGTREGELREFVKWLAENSPDNLYGEIDYIQTKAKELLNK